MLERCSSSSRRVEAKVQGEISSELFLEILQSNVVQEGGQFLQFLSRRRNVSVLRAEVEG